MMTKRNVSSTIMSVRSCVGRSSKKKSWSSSRAKEHTVQHAHTITLYIHRLNKVDSKVTIVCWFSIESKLNSLFYPTVQTINNTSTEGVTTNNQKKITFLRSSSIFCFQAFHVGEMKTTQRFAFVTFGVSVGCIPFFFFFQNDTLQLTISNSYHQDTHNI